MSKIAMLSLLLAFSPAGAWADNHEKEKVECVCTKGCKENCEKGKTENCECKACDCKKSDHCHR